MSKSRSTTKPDRLRSLVDREYQRWLKGPQMNGWLEVAQQCLKKEQARTRRIVKAEQARLAKVTAYSRSCKLWIRAKQDVLNDILSALKGTQL